MKNKRIDRQILLETLIKHETLTIIDLAKEENLGLVPDPNHLDLLLQELRDSGHVEDLPGVLPVTYTITVKGIDEGLRLRNLPGSDKNEL
ncbi:MAG: hypothetical protein K0Q66_900 [Chitinophagaceae bacterium]|jgi:hypothetical protein|nr:hypothetical protein [Chitinophagaceae bacterium]